MNVAFKAGRRRALPLRALIPNAITVLALCVGLGAVRFALVGEWDAALASIVAAGILDGFDGRIARLLRGATRFGAELDSLSDVIAFGVAPAMIVYLWALQDMPRYGWIFALAHAVACALRLARFNANIDADEQPHKSAGFLTGVPAPSGAGLLMLPIFLWIVTGSETCRNFYLVAAWTACIAFLMISNVATFSWSSISLGRGAVFGGLVAMAAVILLLVAVPWLTLSAMALAYVASIPFSMIRYAKVRQQRVALPSEPDVSEAKPAATE